MMFIYDIQQINRKLGIQKEGNGLGFYIFINDFNGESCIYLTKKTVIDLANKILIFYQEPKPEKPNVVQGNFE